MHPAVLLLSLAVSVATMLLRSKTPSAALPPAPAPTGRGYTIAADCAVVPLDLAAARSWARALAASLPELPEWTEEAAIKAWGPIVFPAVVDACPKLQEAAGWDAQPALGYQLALGLAEGLRLHHKAPALVVSVAFAQARAAMLARGWPPAVLIPDAPEVL